MSGLAHDRFVQVGAYPTRRGNHIRPWIDGEPAFRRICQVIETAKHSVWTTVTFMWPSFRMPDGRTPLEALERAAQRGVDVRVIFWRPDAETAHHRTNAFWGAPEHLGRLEQHYPNIKVRWDRAHPGFCQHQKTWLIDADKDSGTSFVGGINLNPHSLVAQGHRGEGHNHDAYVELTGPCVADVHHNFVQRWNEASERRLADGLCGRGADSDLPFPQRLPAARGDAVAQIQRTMHRGRYSNGYPPPGGDGFDVAGGETTNLEQYCRAIRRARRTIYMENQYLEVMEIVESLHNALRRGVAVVLLMPVAPVLSADGDVTPERQAFLHARAQLGVFDRFSLCGIAGLTAAGRRASVYVHAKLMLIDDAWATVGSCNLHRYSLLGNGELNVAFHEPSMVRAMRIELFQEHLDVDTSQLDDVEAVRLFRNTASDNRARHEQEDADWQGLAIRLDPASYGSEPQF